MLADSHCYCLCSQELLAFGLQCPCCLSTLFTWLKVFVANFYGLVADTKKLALVAKVCQPSQHGGLGIREVQACNKALCVKWPWKLVCGKTLFQCSFSHSVPGSQSWYGLVNLLADGAWLKSLDGMLRSSLVLLTLVNLGDRFLLVPFMKFEENVIVDDFLTYVRLHRWLATILNTSVVYVLEILCLISWWTSIVFILFLGSIQW